MDSGYCNSLVHGVGHVGWIVVTVIAWSGCGTYGVDCGYYNSLVQGVRHVGWIVVTAVVWFRVGDMWSGFLLLQ